MIRSIRNAETRPAKNITSAPRKNIIARRTLSSGARVAGVVVAASVGGSGGGCGRWPGARPAAPRG